MLNMMRVVMLFVSFLMIASCEHASKNIITCESDYPEVEVTDADRIYVAGQLANPNKLLLSTQRTRLGQQYDGARLVILYYWKHFVFSRQSPHGLSRQVSIRANLGSDEEAEAYVAAVIADYEDPSDDYIIELDKEYNPITTNEWVQFPDEAPRATDEEIHRFEVLYGCLGSDLFRRDEGGVERTTVVVK